MIKSFCVVVLGLILAGAAGYGQTYTDAHDFGGKLPNGGLDGLNPRCNVIFDASGNMFGTCGSGGANGLGMVWKITPSGTFSDLHDFGGTLPSGTPDGSEPWAGVTLDSSGNLFGTCVNGGLNDNGPYLAGIVWELTSGGTYLDLHDFGGTLPSGKPDGAAPYGGVTVDNAGNLYGTCAIGGANGYSNSDNLYGEGILWKITSTGQYLNLHDFGGILSNNSQDGYSPNAEVTLDGEGNIFGTCYFGGPNTAFGGRDGNGIVWEINTAGNYMDLHDFGGTLQTGTSDGVFPAAGVSFNAAGDLFGTCDNGGANGRGMVWKISMSGIYSDIHDFGGSQIFGGPDGKVPVSGVTFDNAGNLYGTCTGGGANELGVIWEITPTGCFNLHSFGGKLPDGTPDGWGADAGVTLDAAGALYGTCVAGGAINTSGGGDGIVWKFQLNPTFTFSPASVEGGTSSTGTLLLQQPAPQGGLIVNLNSSSPNAIVPSSVTVQANSSQATFIVTTQVVSTLETVVISATSAQGPASATLTIGPPIPTGLSISPSSVTGGGSTVGLVTIDVPAAQGGATVNLESNSSSVTVPIAVIVPAGSRQVSFNVGTTGVSSTTNATITARVGSASVTVNVTVNPPSLTGFTVSPKSVPAGVSSTGTVTLDGPASTGGLTVSLSSSSSNAVVPPTVVIEAGSAVANFAILTVSVAKPPACAVISIAYAGISKSASLAITGATLASITVNPASVKGGSTASATATLTSDAPKGGVTIKLSSPSKLVKLPGSIQIPAGKSSSTFNVMTVPVSDKTLVNITGAVGSIWESATLTIKPPSLSSITVSPSTVLGSRTASGKVMLTSAAAAGGAIIYLTSSNAVASVPMELKVPAGKSSASFTLNTISVGAVTQAVITGKYAGSTATAIITINPPEIKSLTLSPVEIIGGKSSLATVLLATPAPPGGVAIAITSNNVSVTVPSSVTVGAGKTSATFAVQTTPIPCKIVVTLTANLGPTSKSASLIIKP